MIKCLPSFSIVGIPKSGTSALWWYLQSHPKLVAVSKEKCALGETYPVSPIINYFRALPSVGEVCPECLVYEACIFLSTPSNATYPQIYRKILPTISHALLLVRHPLEWLYASYWYWCLDEEKAIMPDCAYNPRTNVTYTVNETDYEISFKRSPELFHDYWQSKKAEVFDFYRDSISSLLDTYGSNLIAISTENFYMNTADILNDIVSQLSLDAHDFREVASKVVNVNDKPGAMEVVDRRPGNYPPILSKTRNIAASSIREFCVEMEGMLHIELCKYWSN